VNGNHSLSMMRQSFLNSYNRPIKRDWCAARDADEMRQRVMALEAEMLKRKQVVLPLFHHFADGLYMRELHIPKGVTSTGKIHKHEHIGILTEGVRDMLINGEVKTVAAPFTAIVKPGEKLACYTWEDAVYVTIHPNPDNERDIAKLEARYVCDTEEEYLAFAAFKLKEIASCPKYRSDAAYEHRCGQYLALFLLASARENKRRSSEIEPSFPALHIYDVERDEMKWIECGVPKQIMDYMRYRPDLVNAAAKELVSCHS